MELHEKIQGLYKTTNNYPELVKGFIALGMQSYVVDVATSIILYRFPDGNTVLHQSTISPRTINEKFNKEQTFAAVKASQQKKINYPQFMEEIAKAGVRFYEATLAGDRKRVTYIGSGDVYEELIPL